MDPGESIFFSREETHFSRVYVFAFAQQESPAAQPATTFDAFFPSAPAVLIGEHRSGKRFLRFLPRKRGCGNWETIRF